MALVAVSVPLFCPPIGLLERSWRPPGPNESALERLLGAPREISRQFSTILGPERLPKWSPGGSQIEPQRRLELKRAKPQNFEDVSHENLNFESPGPPKTDPKRVQNRFPIASLTRKLSKSLLIASWSALGSSWSRKNLAWIGSWTARGHRGDRFQHAWGPNTLPKWVPGGSPNRGPKADQA